MPKLQRKSAKLFAENATATAGGIAQFGSLAAGTPNYSTDPDVIQGLQQYSDGWSAAVLGTKSPALEDRNALDFLLSYQQAYIMQRGVPEWISTETYYQGSFVSLSDGRMYVSKIDNNTNKNPSADTSETYWLRFPTPAEVAAKVSKSGDTMTGTLVNSGRDVSAMAFVLDGAKDNKKDIAASYDNANIGGLRFDAADSAKRTQLYVRDASNNLYTMGIYLDSLGNLQTNAPACDNANSILTTVAITKAETGYVKLGNGMILQWGVVSHGYDARKTVTLGYPFGNTNYKVFLTNYNTGARSAENAMAYTVYAKDSTSFSFFASRLENKSTGTQYASYLAVGY